MGLPRLQQYLRHNLNTENHNNTLMNEPLEVSGSIDGDELNNENNTNEVHAVSDDVENTDNVDSNTEQPHSLGF